MQRRGYVQVASLRFSDQRQSSFDGVVRAQQVDVDDGLEAVGREAVDR